MKPHHHPLSGRLLLAGALLALLQGVAWAQPSNVVRVVTYDYDLVTGEVTRETVEPDTVALKLVTEYARLPVGGVEFGLVSSRTLKWTDPVSSTLQTRVVQQLSYDAQGRFALSTTNAKGHVETRSYEAASGQVLSLLDANSLTTSWQYDGWGRKLRETRADGTATSWAYRQCVDACTLTTTTAVTVLVTQNWHGSNQTTVPTEAFADVRGREVMTRSWGLAGAAIVAERAYDDQGRLASVGRARFQSSGSTVWTHYLRDDLGRVTQIQHPNSAGSGYDLSLPPKTVSLAEWFNPSKENGSDEDDESAVHAGVQARSGAAGQGRAEPERDGEDSWHRRADAAQLGQG